MNMAHMIKDEEHFKKVHKQAGDFLFEALRKMEEMGIE
jgi:hypothetical protein